MPHRHPNTHLLHQLYGVLTGAEGLGAVAARQVHSEGCVITTRGTIHNGGETGGVSSGQGAAANTVWELCKAKRL